MREEIAVEMSRLRVDLLQRTGAVVFTPDMTVREAQWLHPQTQQVLAGFHLGGCSNCAVDMNDTLAKVCNQSGTDINVLSGNLNSLVSGGRRQSGGVGQAVKLPNVMVEF